MLVSPGTRLGPYEVVSAIGAGGMGVVYRGRDTKLQRDVAIKVLPEAFAQDPERLARFEREARSLAALNHQNIATIYGLEELDGGHALVMELVEGLTLAERIALGAIPFDETLPIAKQIADALEAAHEQGIIHRDLKPANIKVRPDGTVKVLDFGLAKAMEPTGAMPPNVTQSPTVTSSALMTKVGVLLGTAAYMSPEQARGRPVDRRADIWAFGCVLFEMLTGKRAFEAEDASLTLARVLDRDADFTALPSKVPSRVRQALRACLQKEPRQRAQAIGDVRLVLEGAFEAPAEPATQGRSPGPQYGPSRWALGATAIAFAIAFAAVSVLYLSQVEPTLPTLRFTVTIPGDAPEEAQFELSPDGSTLAIAAVTAGQRGLWVRPLDALEARLLPGTDGAELPFWSPDGTQIGFFADRRLKRVSIAGGAPSIIAEVGAAFQGASWNNEGIIVFSSNGLKRVASAGGAITPVELSALVGSVFYPRFLPDGQHLFFRANRLKGTESGVFAGSLDGSLVQQVVAAFSNAAYTPSTVGRASGFMLFEVAGSLMAQRFDARELRVVGDAFTVAERIAGATGRANFSLSSNGDLAYRSATLFQLTWVDRDGATLDEVGSPGVEWSPGGNSGTIRLSPDETRVAYSKTHSEGGRTNRDVWQLDLLRNVPEQLTFASGPDLVPVWSPDSSQIVFTSNRDRVTSFDSYVLSPGGEERLLIEMPGGGWPLDWSPDGRFVLQSQAGRVWIVPIVGESSQPYGQFSTAVARFHPHGQWVAYVSNENDVWVRSFPGAGGARRVSPAGGTEPQWRRDGRELFYVGSDGALMAVAVTSDGTDIRFGRPTRLFPSAAGYQASHDGKRFLIARPADPAPPGITMVLNWRETVDR